MDDAQIVQLYWDRNEQAIHATSDKYGNYCTSIAMNILSNQEDAEELTQDTFLKAFQHLSSYKGNSSFSTWIYSIAYNMAISNERKKKYDTLVMDDTLLANISEQQVDDALNDETEERFIQLSRAIKQLAPDEQTIISLFYQEEKSLIEIAFILGMTENNTKVKLHRIRKKIYVLMKQEKR